MKTSTVMVCSVLGAAIFLQGAVFAGTVTINPGNGVATNVQQRITGRHYAMLDASVAEHNDKVGDLFDRSPIWGVQLGYYYNSGIAGPLGCSFGWSSHTHRVHFYVSLGLEF